MLKPFGSGELKKNLHVKKKQEFPSEVKVFQKLRPTNMAAKGNSCF
jgi:hypothetical protein